MPVSHETEQQVRHTLVRYCEGIDNADFAALAALFEHGRWFAASAPGAEPLRTWLEEHIILYDGQTLTRHEMFNLIVEEGEHPDEVAFRCYITVWHDLPNESPRLLAHARFSGTFRKRDDGWWWNEHRMTASYAGDLSSHIKGGLAAMAPGQEG
jgi:hypothetical protein